MGPRSRRRLVWAAIAVAVIALAVVGGTWLTRSSHHSASNDSVVESPASIRFAANQSKVIFGMTHQQVRRLVGPPVKILGNCWQYPPYNATGPTGKTFIIADRLCFYEGRYSIEHFELDGKWEDPPTRITLPSS